MPDIKHPSLQTKHYVTVNSMKSGIAYDEKGLAYIVLVLNEVIHVLSRDCADDIINQLSEHVAMHKSFAEANKLIG